MNKTIFVDVDDTLVRSFGSKQVPMGHVIESVKRLAASGAQIFLWSSGGAEYCKRIAEEFGLADCVSGYLPKPDAYLDDQKVEEWRFCRHYYTGQVDDLISDWTEASSAKPN